MCCWNKSHQPPQPFFNHLQPLFPFLGNTLVEMYGSLPAVGVMVEETQQTTARLEARLPNDVHALLKRAAEIEGVGSPSRTNGKSPKPF
jgi:hypothetical protein